MRFQARTCRIEAVVSTFPGTGVYLHQVTYSAPLGLIFFSRRTLVYVDCVDRREEDVLNVAKAVI